ncbi:hypothetical protein GOP47_0006302 [Adiantum capillus-veneris]|uniref:Uncharacterized protein n=1 Tax=Adiantum capillus-veneris TaxID=13818 RepID=A0A9D4V2L9_ADICA|nr:hypothetical protein GOP47_0006302 [Adiantum capillus-veneris]
MATLSCLKVISTNYQLDLKRLILSVTPTYLAKHLLNRLKHIGRRRQADKCPTNYSYQRKFYKFLRTFRMKHKVCRASGVLNRELGAGDIHHAHQLSLVHEHIDINDILEGAIDDGTINDDDSYGAVSDTPRIFLARIGSTLMMNSLKGTKMQNKKKTCLYMEKL